MSSGASGNLSADAVAGARVVNLLQIAEAQQVMLEVKIAEVSKTLLDKLGADYQFKSGNWGFVVGANAILGTKAITDFANRFLIDAKANDGLVKILAEPNIVAISGQEASFLAGGKILHSRRAREQRDRRRDGRRSKKKSTAWGSSSRPRCWMAGAST